MEPSVLDADTRDARPLQVSWEDGERAFRRTSHDDPGGDRRSVIIVTPAAENPTSAHLDRLAHEYGLRDQLDAPWAVRPLDLVRERGRTTLVLEDRGAEPLHRLMRSPMDPPRFLRLALALAAALGGLHERGLVHKDISPANIMVNEATGQAWLTGFGAATRLPRERQGPTPPEMISGTLAYMAPEQTGRMNRSIDSRSDLYSLGVTFYQMLTGALPFTASEPMEWVHCHIARAPAPPRDRLGTIPETLSQLVMKLLAKTAEDRYQTAAGLEHDLRRCRAEWDTQGRIDAFPLGERDAPDRLLIPEKLYGRSREVAALLGAFEQVVATGAPQLVLVSGYSGVGKSSVVHEIHKALVPPRGLFASGKFDQYKRDIPYATLAQAFQSLVRQILSRSEAELEDWRHALGEALGPNGRLIVDLIPELELIIGHQPPVADLSPQDAQRRFHVVLRRFIGVFARPEHPLALFLDDLQWLDVATLDLIEDLLTQGDVRRLLLIGAYRDNEVDAAHPLVRKLAAIRGAGAPVRDIVLAPLSHDDLGQLVDDTLHCERGTARPLVRLVQEKTGGNPFFAIQFLQALAEEELLVFNHAAARWTWNLRRIHAKRYTDNVVDLMVGKLGRLPTRTQAVLREFACVGASAASALLETVVQASPDELHDSLWEAVRAGLVLRSEDAYAFQHDRIQEAAYSLIPEDARAQAHLRIGRLLLTQTPADRREDIVFEIASQFNRSTALIVSRDEREQVAQLNLTAGKRAKNAAAYSSALAHLAGGRALLAEDCWTRQYPLTFELEFHRAECELLTRDLDTAEERLSMLARRAENVVDLAAVTALRVDLYMMLARSERSIDVALEYFRQVGIDWSPHPTDDDLRQEFERLWGQLGARPIEDLIDLPLMSDAGTLATMDVLSKLMPSGNNTDSNLNSLLIARMANLSLAHGNSNASCLGYVSLALVLATDFGDHATARRFAQLSLDLVEKRGLDAFKARIYLRIGAAVSPFSQHVRFGRALILQGRDEADRVGDVLYAGHCRSHAVKSLIASGAPLEEVECEALDALDFMRRTGSSFVFLLTLNKIYLIRRLRGLPLELRLFDGTEVDEGEYERYLEDPDLANPAFGYWTRKLQASVFAEDYASALEAVVKARGMLDGPSPIERAEYHFYAALALAGSVGAVDGAQYDWRTAQREAFAAHHRQLQIWAEHCPENFENRAALVAAELARLEGRVLDAQRLYEQAIRSSRANGFVHNEALACETAARFYAARGFEVIAGLFLERARDGYLRWGADGKVRQLEARHPALAIADPRAEPRETPSPDQRLDVAAVVKASQALSSEMLLPRLVEQLMTIALQSAGADRGLLILPDQNDYRIEAEARADGERIVLHTDASDDPAVPETIIRFAMRTYERVILDDAAKPNLFSDDPYLGLRRPRSVLCLPLVRQGMLSGLLYLENTLAPDVFTPERARLLELLASQASISLENAGLYTDLQRSEAFLAQGQRISQTASFGWSIASGESVWSAENYNLLEYDPGTRASVDLAVSRIHPDDRDRVRRLLDAAWAEGKDFDSKHRLLMPDGRVKHVHTTGRAVAIGNLDFMGAVRDVTERVRAEEVLHQTQAELAHVARVATLNAMTASIAHEVNQPLSGILTNANTCVRMLGADPPNLAGAVETARRTIRDANRAAEVISRLRAMFSAKAPTMEIADLNDVARDVIALSAAELRRSGALLQTDFADDLPPVSVDRVQVQQVVLNLLLNAADAMAGVEDRPRTLLVQTGLDDDGAVRLAVQDSGTGVDPEAVEKLFGAFYTTKPDGMGVGLSISRSIIEKHDGRLWAQANEGPGATFSFCIPAAAGDRPQRPSGRPGSQLA